MVSHSAQQNNLTTDRKDTHRYENPCLSMVKTLNLTALSASLGAPDISHRLNVHSINQYINCS